VAIGAEYFDSILPVEEPKRVETLSHFALLFKLSDTAQET